MNNPRVISLFISPCLIIAFQVSLAYSYHSYVLHALPVSCTVVLASSWANLSLIMHRKTHTSSGSVEAAVVLCEDEDPKPWVDNECEVFALDSEVPMEAEDKKASTEP